MGTGEGLRSFRFRSLKVRGNHSRAQNWAGQGEGGGRPHIVNEVESLDQAEGARITQLLVQGTTGIPATLPPPPKAAFSVLRQDFLPRKTKLPDSFPPVQQGSTSPTLQRVRGRKI